MDRIEKALRKLSYKERKKIKDILAQINDGDFRKLNLKKLKGKTDIYRVRKGDIRIILHKTKGNSIKILAVERRSSKTYKKK